MRERLSRRIWDLERFGLTPRKLVARVGNRDLPTILCNSLPKAGTHLIERALCLHPKLYRKLSPTLRRKNMPPSGDVGPLLDGLKPGQILLAHLPYSDEASASITRTGVRHVLMVRDPRDIVVSQAHYMVSNDRHPHHPLMASLPDFMSRLQMVIAGNEETGLVSIRKRLEDYAGWLSDGTTIVRFEDLVGSRGGGEYDEQVRSLQDVYESVGLSVTGGEIEKLAGGLFSSVSPTFRAGSIGQSMEQFDEETTKMFDELAGPMLAVYGYAS